jgi:hypothetical protein
MRQSFKSPVGRLLLSGRASVVVACDCRRNVRTLSTTGVMRVATISTGDADRTFDLPAAGI